MTKRNLEIPGTERPSIDAIDMRAASYLGAASTAKDHAEKLKDAKANVLIAMEENADQLEQDLEGNHVYPYHDGSTFKIFVLRRDNKLDVKNVKQKPEDEGGAIE